MDDIVSTLAVAVALLAAAPLQSQTTLRAADVHDADYPTAVALSTMADQLREETRGRLSLKLYTGGQLGDELDTIEITILGGIDLNRVSLAPLNSIIPETLVLAMPFLFRSTAHMRETLDGPIGEEILAAFEPHGLIGLAYYDSGARSLYNVDRPVRTPEDVAGMKVRVQSSEVFVAMVEALGGNATPMGFGQVYESLALGTIDAAENNWPSYHTTGHFEVAKHYSRTEHVMVPEVLVMSRYRWKRLSSDDRAAIRAAAKASVPVMRELWDARVETSRQQVLASGNFIIEDVDKEPFVRAMRPVYERFLTTESLRGLARRIQSVGAP